VLRSLTFPLQNVNKINEWSIHNIGKKVHTYDWEDRCSSDMAFDWEGTHFVVGGKTSAHVYSVLAPQSLARLWAVLFQGPLTPIHPPITHQEGESVPLAKLSGHSKPVTTVRRNKHVSFVLFADASCVVCCVLGAGGLASHQQHHRNRIARRLCANCNSGLIVLLVLFLAHNFILFFIYFSLAQERNGTIGDVSTATPTTQSFCHLHQTSSIRLEAFFLADSFDPLATAQPSFQVITAFQGLDL